MADPGRLDVSTGSSAAAEYVPDEQDASEEGALQAELVIKGRNVTVPDHFRVHVADKLAKLERFDLKVRIYDVELQHEPNPRQSKSASRVEITARGKGPVVRAEACSDSFYSALELAVDKIENRLRKAKDRRKVSYGEKRPMSVAAATAQLAKEAEFAISADSHFGEPDENLAGPGHVVRTKDHPATPMSVDDALYEMELVGHDFYLFHDSESDRPSVVYRRHAFDYGLIRLA